MFIVIWKFQVDESLTKDFEQLYGQDGKWVALFKKEKIYIKTDLIKDVSNPNTYMTIDYWKSRSFYKNFLRESKSQFEIIDKEGESLTKSEFKIGWFEETNGI